MLFPFKLREATNPSPKSGLNACEPMLFPFKLREATNPSPATKPSVSNDKDK